MRKSGKMLALAAVAGTLGMGGCASIQVNGFNQANEFSLYPTGSCSSFQLGASRTAPIFGRMQRVSAVHQRFALGNNATAIRNANAKKLAAGECN
ncbi:MAG TPA: hypothetical protein VFQ39_06345 [Longimicrobium sp.]|nr:hypothetical protein [Longimicrobium sp.]